MAGGRHRDRGGRAAAGELGGGRARHRPGAEGAKEARPQVVGSVSQVMAPSRVGERRRPGRARRCSSTTSAAATLFGADAVGRVRLSPRFALELSGGLRLGPRVAAPHGAVNAIAGGRERSRSSSISREASEASVAAGPELSANWLEFRAEPFAGAEGMNVLATCWGHGSAVVCSYGWRSGARCTAPLGVGGGITLRGVEAKDAGRGRRPSAGGAVAGRDARTGGTMSRAALHALASALATAAAVLASTGCTRAGEVLRESDGGCARGPAGHRTRAWPPGRHTPAPCRPVSFVAGAPTARDVWASRPPMAAVGRHRSVVGGRPLDRTRRRHPAHLCPRHPTAACGAGVATPTASSAAAIASLGPSRGGCGLAGKAVDVRTALRVHVRDSGGRQRLVLGLQQRRAARARGDVYPGDDRLQPTQLGTTRDWTFVATGQGHGCGIRAPWSPLLLGTEHRCRSSVRAPGMPAGDPNPRSSWHRAGLGGGRLLASPPPAAARATAGLWCWGAMGSGALAVGNVTRTPTQPRPGARASPTGRR